MPLNKLEGNLKARWDRLATVYSDFVKEFGSDAVSSYTVKQRMPLDLKYTNEYFEKFCGGRPKTYFEALIGGQYGCDDNMIKYIFQDSGKDPADELIYLIDDAGANITGYNMKETAYGIYNAMTERILFANLIPQEDIDRVITHMVESKLLRLANGYNCYAATQMLDYLIKNSPNILSYIDNIKKLYPEYQNYPLILLNTAVDSDERKKIIKKTFIQKHINRYIKSMRDIDDYTTLGDFIDAVVIQNNRIKEKEKACQDILERFFIGMNGERYSFCSEMLSYKKNFDPFFDKYGAYLSLSYLDSIYSDQYTGKNKNIRAYFMAICRREKDITKKLDMLLQAPKIAEYGFNEILRDLHKEFGENLDDLDPQIAKRLIAISLKSHRATLYTWQHYRDIIDAELHTMINDRPELFIEFLPDAKYAAPNYWHSSYSESMRSRSFKFELLNPESQEKCRLFSDAMMRRGFLVYDDREYNIYRKSVHALLFARDFYDYLGSTCKVPTNTEAGAAFYKYYLSPFILNETETQDLLAKEISTLNSYGEAFNETCKCVASSDYSDVLIDLFDKITTVGKRILPHEEFELLENSMKYISDSISILTGIK